MNRMYIMQQKQIINLVVKIVEQIFFFTFDFDVSSN